MRMRLIGWSVQPVIMSDDGENLEPAVTGAQTILAAHWKAFKDGGDERALEQLRAQIEGPEAGPDLTEGSLEL